MISSTSVKLCVYASSSDTILFYFIGQATSA